MIFLTLLAVNGLWMAPDDQEKTGFSKLTKRERAALEQWVEEHYEKRAQPLAQKKIHRRPYIEENLKGGRLIRLSDGTLWQIHPADTPIAHGWITPVEILIIPSDDKNYPELLTNSLTHSVVRAKPAPK